MFGRKNPDAEEDKFKTSSGYLLLVGKNGAAKSVDISVKISADYWQMLFDSERNEVINITITEIEETK